MRPRLHIGFVFLVMALLASCVREVEPTVSPCPALVEVDSMMWSWPDSALAMLLEFVDSPEAGSLDEFNGHYCQMLVSELLYKNDYRQSNRPDLLEAVDYFDSIGDAFLDARAHYIKGVGFYERDSVVDACAEYLRALEVMEEGFPKKELTGHKARFMTYTFNRLGDMFSDQFMMESAITCYKNSYAYSVISPISEFSISGALYRIGKQYDVNGDVDSASYYYQQAIESIPDTNHLYYRDIVTSQVLLSYRLTHQAEKSIQRLQQLAVLAENYDEMLTRYFVIGGIYYEDDRFDSARLCLEPVFEDKDDLIVRIQAAQYLQIIYDSLGNSIKSDECMRFLAQQKKSEGQNKALVSRLNDLFQDYLMEEQQKLSEAERKKSAKKAVGMVVPIGLIVAFALVVLVRNRSKKLHQKDMEAERQSHKLQQDALSGRLKKSNRELKELKSQLTQETEVVAKTEPAVSFFDEPVCRLILERVKEGRFKAQMDCEVYKSYAMDKVQVIALREAVDRHFGGFCARLKRTYPELTYSDLDYCCLYLLGLNDADVSALMQKAYTTISQRSRKIKTILGNKQQLSATLRSLAGSDLLC